MLNQARINLYTLRQNVKNIKSKLQTGVKYCAVVKADAYGHGAGAVANAIYDLVDCYAVALVSEGIELRNSGIDKEILVLSPALKSDYKPAIKNDLTLTVQDKESVSLLERDSKRLGKRTGVHIKFNVGMNRFGVDSLEELKEIAEYITQKEHLLLKGMYSHLSCPQNKKLLKRALDSFSLANNLVKGYNNNAICHISASGGFLMGAQADMVRIGILMYGYKPFASNYVSVKPIMKVYAPVLETRNLKKGQGALYGSTKLNEDTTLSLVRFGYADGLERRCINLQVNNRCMDVTAIKGRYKGFYPIMTNADYLAKEYGTISYEILCKVALRAEKIYIR